MSEYHSRLGGIARTKLSRRALSWSASCFHLLFNLAPRRLETLPVAPIAPPAPCMALAFGVLARSSTPKGEGEVMKAVTHVLRGVLTPLTLFPIEEKVIPLSVILQFSGQFSISGVEPQAIRQHYGLPTEFDRPTM